MKVFNLSGKFLFDVVDNHFCHKGPQKRRVEDVDLESKDFKNVVLENLLFESGNFDDAHAKGVKILSCDFEGSWLCNADFSDSYLEKVEFYDVQAYGAKFTETQLIEVAFLGANLAGADFRGGVLGNVTFRSDNMLHKTDLSGVDFSNVDLSRVKFEGALYDAMTKFPRGFESSRYPGLVRIAEG